MLGYARETGTRLIPYGGGTSVVGHINPLGARPSICVDMSRLDRLISIDETSLLATFGAGIAGPAIEAHLKERGYMLGHFPQSFEFSSLGGWIAAEIAAKDRPPAFLPGSAEPRDEVRGEARLVHVVEAQARYADNLRLNYVCAVEPAALGTNETEIEHLDEVHVETDAAWRKRDERTAKERTQK